MLDEKYQDRLEQWRKNTLAVPSKEKVRTAKQRSFVAQRDYGDDIRDYERKDQEAWMREISLNPLYGDYR